MAEREDAAMTEEELISNFYIIQNTEDLTQSEDRILVSKPILGLKALLKILNYRLRCLHLWTIGTIMVEITSLLLKTKVVVAVVGHLLLLLNMNPI